MRWIGFSMSLFVGLAAWTGCREHTDGGGPGRVGAAGVFVINEGNFSAGTGDISYYDFSTEEMSNGLFLAANGEAAGDIVQDILILDSLAVIVVNNSNRLRVVRWDTFEEVRDIPVIQPRFITLASPTEAFVSTWNHDVKVLDLSTLQIVDSIAVGPYPEGVISRSGRIFVANSGFGYSNTLSIIDAVTRTVESTATVGYGPMRLAFNQDSSALYVACAGNEYGDPKVPGGIYVVDAITGVVVDSLVAVVQSTSVDTIFPTKVAVHGAQGYFISGYSGSILMLDLSTMTVVDTLQGNFYGIATNPYDSADDRIYTGTAALLGRFQVYSRSGIRLVDLPVGEFPSGMAFQHQR